MSEETGSIGKVSGPLGLPEGEKEKIPATEKKTERAARIIGAYGAGRASKRTLSKKKVPAFERLKGAETIAEKAIAEVSSKRGEKQKLPSELPKKREKLVEEASRGEKRERELEEIPEEEEEFKELALKREHRVSEAEEKEAQVFNSIMAVLQSGKREKGESKPALPLLLQQAENKKEANAFVTVNDRLYRVIIKKDLAGSFTLNYTEPCLTEEDIISANLSPNDARFIRDHKDTLLINLFHLALKTPFEKKKAEASFPHAVVQLHVKEDGTVSVGIGKFVAAGGFKEVQRIVKSGVCDKIYAEAVLKDFLKKPLLEKEAFMMKKFAGPHLLKLRKYFVRSHVRYNPKSEAADIVKQVGIRSEFCDKGDAYDIMELPPQTTKERLTRFRLVRDVALALNHIHNYSEDKDASGARIRYAFMDLKPENLFLKTTADGSLEGILGDINPQPEGASSITTLEFADWEIRKAHLQGKSYLASQKNDMWGLGLMLFDSIYGASENPIENKDLSSFVFGYKKILNKLGHTPADELIRKLLVFDRDRRPSLTPELLQEFDTVDAYLEGIVKSCPT